MNRRMQGAAGEEVACDRLRDQGWKVVKRNFTIRGGELDIIVQNKEFFVCVEVKTVGRIDDIMSYITDKKMTTVRRTFQNYLRKYPTNKQPRIDVIFVKEGEIWEVFENVTGN